MNLTPARSPPPCLAELYTNRQQLLTSSGQVDPAPAPILRTITLPAVLSGNRCSAQEPAPPPPRILPHLQHRQVEFVCVPLLTASQVLVHPPPVVHELGRAVRGAVPAVHGTEHGGLRGAAAKTAVKKRRGRWSSVPDWAHQSSPGACSCGLQ